MIAHGTRFLRRALVIGTSILSGLTAVAQSQGPVLDPTFLPTQVWQVIAGAQAQRVNGLLYDVVRQPDGKYLVGGVFSEINGAAASNLARLLPDGTLDAAFTAACATNGPVYSLALQSDGRVLVGGEFTLLAGDERIGIGRLLPNGPLDAAFAPPSTTIAGTAPSVTKLLMQPDGRILLSGYFNLQGAGAAPQRLARLEAATGQYDSSFQPTFPIISINALLLQSDGKVVVGGSAGSYQLGTLLTRLLPNGSVDNTFATFTSYFTSSVSCLAFGTEGKFYAGGNFQESNYNLRRYLPNGTLDTSFDYTGNQTYSKALALQPNGRLLVGNRTMPLERVTANGSLDASFPLASSPTAGGGNFNRGINQLLVQSDGALMVAGSLQQPGLSYVAALVRLTDANVLRMPPSAAATRTAAWPVPTHDVLHLSLDAASKPQLVQLLDALGRPVLTLEQPTATLTLPMTGLAAGTYHIEVRYAEGGRVLRRVVLY